MRLLSPDSLQLSASDLSSFLGCRHRTALDLGVVLGDLAKPTGYAPYAQELRDRGAEHEAAYVAALQAEGLDVVDVGAAADRRAATLEALRRGVDVVVQGEFVSGGWFGRPDILRRVDTPSDLGGWSYEVYDTKLARETRGGTVLQLAVYSELLGRVQGRMPADFHVVTPDPVQGQQRFRVDHYAAYYRLVKHLLDQSVTPAFIGSAGPRETGRPSPSSAVHQALADAHYPEPVEQCDYCRWSERCEQRRRDDDHLSFIAGAGRLHRAELESQGIATLAAAAAMPVPITFTPARGSRDTYVRIREQARVQFEQRESGRPVWELLPAVVPDTDEDVPRTGLQRLPEPTRRDIFLDLEAARFAREGGREYLFGVWTQGEYRCWWATTDAEERAAFEAVVDAIMAAWDAEPGVHVYHFGHYEAAAFKRLAGRYATRTAELDRLLRGGRLIDLHAVTRQAIRAGVESYSIKQLEQYYGYRRVEDLRGVGMALHQVELALEAADPAGITPALRGAVERYNADDCRSTEALRTWLEGPVRAKAEARGDALTRPPLSDGRPTEDTGAQDSETERLRVRLLDGIDGDPGAPDHPAHAQWLLAYLIDWHRREEKAAWWEYLHVLGLDDMDEWRETPKAIAGLEFLEEREVVLRKNTGKPTGSVVNRYRYPPQEVDLGKRAELTCRGESPFGGRFGSLEAYDREAGTLDIKVPAGTPTPDALFIKNIVPSKDLQASVMSLAEASLDTPGDRACGLELLLRRPPRSRRAPVTLARDGETPVAAAIRVVGELDRSYLAVQGPPGAGKTYAGAQMIRALVRAGKKVGVTAVSHKVITNLLTEVRAQALAAGETVRLARKGDEEDEDVAGIEVIGDNGAALEAIRARECDVLGGTAWLWAKAAAASAVDVLFVDEAGQMSLANVLAVSRAADSLVLLGDPQQLEQPQKGSHPDGVDVSALQHVIGDAPTMPPELGIFLPETYRLAPAVCQFTSEVFYEGKLREQPDLARQRLSGSAPYEGAGLWLVPVEHVGNQNASREEARVVAALVERLLAPGSCWGDRHGASHQLTPGDLRVVSPYNAQVNALKAHLAAGVPVGTVDKFQGQEAPVVIYSMATSRPEDAPRGMEFLYSLNRLNVATSRARCAAIVVASPALFEPECRTPRQMQLANALCRFRELAITPAATPSGC